VIISDRFRMFFDGSFPERFLILMHDIRTVEEVIGVFYLASHELAESVLAESSFAAHLVAEGVVALDGGQPAGTRIYAWQAVSKAFSPSCAVRLELSPSTPDEFDRWILSPDQSTQE
jgi:hypothetical protein